MNKKLFFLPIFFGMLSVFFIACDRDYNELGANIVSDDHFDFEKYTEATIKAYNYKTGPIASNNLPINPFGIYENPAFGTTQANFVTQVTLATENPKFYDKNSPEYTCFETKIDSVILNIPYFSHVTKTNTDGSKEYELDSIYGVNEAKFRLKVYQSNYFLRDLDPDASLNPQMFFTDKDQEIDDNKIPVLLNNSSNQEENNQFFFNKKEIITKSKNSKGEEVIARTAPAMRLHLDTDVFTDIILNAPSGQLLNNTVFKNYFRGLYFKAESLGSPANMAMLKFTGGNITIYYTQGKLNGDKTCDPSHESKSLVLNFSGNTVSLLNNSNENADYLSAMANPDLEAEKLYLKGGEGAIAAIDVFGPDTDGNGIADEIDAIKAKGWLINDASLIFTIDKTAMADARIAEPNRIYLYDLTNKKVLLDYTTDFTSVSANPKLNKYIFGGLIQKEATANGRGLTYRIRITNHVRDLIKNGSKNVRLGLSVTENIGNVAFSKLKTPSTYIDSAPAMSVMNPLGTILYGTNIPSGEANYDNRIKFEIYYTKPN